MAPVNIYLESKQYYGCRFMYHADRRKHALIINMELSFFFKT